MGKLRDNLNLIFSNLLFGANFSIYVSLVRNWFDFRQLFLLQVGAAALFFHPFRAAVAPHAPYALGRSEKHPDRDGADYLRLDVHDAVGRDLHQSRRRIDSGHAGAGLHAADRRRDAPRAFFHGCGRWVSRRRSAARASCSSNGDSIWSRERRVGQCAGADRRVVDRRQYGDYQAATPAFRNAVGHGVVLSHRRGDHLPLFSRIISI